MVADPVVRLGPGNKPFGKGDKSLVDSFFQPFDLKKYGIDVYVRGAVGTRANNLDEKIIDPLRNTLFADGAD